MERSLIIARSTERYLSLFHIVCTRIRALVVASRALAAARVRARVPHKKAVTKRSRVIVPPHRAPNASVMHIEEVCIDGFKSYAKRTVVPDFDPLFNAITGLNGSGKSNILDSICFVLGISNLTHVRTNDRSRGRARARRVCARRHGVERGKRAVKRADVGGDGGTMDDAPREGNEARKRAGEARDDGDAGDGR